jgi:hypothetical protein
MFTPFRKLLFCLSILIMALPHPVLSQYTLDKTGTLQINSLIPLEIIDFHPEKNLYLGYFKTPEGLKLALAYGKGEIMIQKVLVGQGPNQISTTANCIAFSKDGDVWVQSPFEIVLFDQKLNVKARSKYPSGTNTQIYGRMEVFNYFYPKRGSSHFSFLTIPTGTSRYLDRRDFRTSHLIEIYNPELEKLYEIAPVSERQLSSKLDKSIGVMYFPVYALDDEAKKLYLTASIDKEITIYNLTTGNLENRVKISHGEFKSLEKNPISTESLPSYKNRINLSGKNHKIHLLDHGLIILEYIREIPQGIYENKLEETPNYHHFKDPGYHRLIAFDKTKQLTGDLSLPENGKLMISLPGNRLLFQIENPDVEEDFIRYEIYQMVKN